MSQHRSGPCAASLVGLVLAAVLASDTWAERPVPTAAATKGAKAAKTENEPPADQPAAEPAREAQPQTEEAELSPAEKKRRAMEERVAEYLANKERRRLEAEARAASAPQPKEQKENEKVTAKASAPTSAPREKSDQRRYPPLPRELAAAQAEVRKSHLAADPTIQRYLTRIDRSQASPDELAAFGNFLADTGMNRLARAYYEVALRLQKKDPVLWNNMGTIYRQLGEWDKAKQAFGRALSLNPAYAMAHYNLGAIYDEQRNYDQAVREYRIALTLDSQLGEPEYNPSAANNERLLAVKLLIYQEKSGNVGLPLVPLGEPIELRTQSVD